jgi:transcriptional regulator with XRE-family HTH domain
MKSTLQYLDELRAKLDLPSDYAVANLLGVTRAAVSKWRQGRTTFDDLTACRVADALGVDPMEIIAAANFERADNERARAVWQTMWGKAAGTIALSLTACAVGALAVVPSPVRASEQASSAILYIMSNRRRGPKTTVSGLKHAA